MIHRHYLLAITAAWVQSLPQAPAFLRQLEAGRLLSARELAAQAAEGTDDNVHAAMWLQANADMALLAGDWREAHSAYGRSLRQANGSFATFLTERAAARKALAGEMPTPPAQSFWRTPAAGTPWDDGMERLAGCALLCHDSAFPQSAQRHVADLAARASARRDAGWRCIAAVMALDFQVQQRLHRLPELGDHVYWTQGDTGEAPLPASLPASLSQTVGLETPCLASRLLAVRVEQLRRLSDAVDGARMVHTPVEAPSFSAQFAAAHRQAECLELALVALAGRHLGEAEEILRPFERQDEALLAPCESLHCELLYCLSRLRMLQGRQEEGVLLYRRYASLAVHRVRQRHALIRRLAEVPGTVAQGASDDIGARLPARYRRAYNWMLSHIGEAGLNVKDVAAVIGVTERALQQAFKRHIGDSPTEVIRRLRMQQIHETLLYQGTGRELIMDVAHRFGVCNRTTLATSYRKYYAQSPSKSMDLLTGQA
jgi:AraC-like DNA-binding protein